MPDQFTITGKLTPEGRAFFDGVNAQIAALTMAHRFEVSRYRQADYFNNNRRRRRGAPYMRWVQLRQAYRKEAPDAV